MTFLVQRIIGVNQRFFKIIENFRKLLPPSDKRARSSYSDQLGMTHLDMDTQTSQIDQKEIDYFLKELEDFEYNSVVLRKESIQSYSKNIQRIIKTTNSPAMTVGFLQHLLENETFESGKPYLFGPKIYKYIKF